MAEHENEPWPPLDHAAFAAWRDRHLQTPFAVIPAGAVGAALWVVVALFALLALGLLASRPDAVGTVLALLLLGIGGFLVWMTRRATARSVRRFDRDGVELGGGRRLPWSTLRGVETHYVVTESQRRRLWRTELQFGDAVAWIVPNRTRNLDDVLAFVAALPVPQRMRSRQR
jgi:hypothetical protein